MDRRSVVGGPPHLPALISSRVQHVPFALSGQDVVVVRLPQVPSAIDFGRAASPAQRRDQPLLALKLRIVLAADA